jgi:N-acyl-D-aspartate/D-glutamate deacylase
MARDLDLVIRNGSIVDGTGNAPRDGDVAVKDGRIVEVGKVAERGGEEIDARGHIVTPGFVDIHTHYDAQAVWDSRLIPSSWHGVTTVVMGNCGVGFAPCKPEHREKLVELMEGVEDIPGAVMREALDWRWETFPEFLAAVGEHHHDVDICTLLPHAALRVYVMGERAIRHEKATADDIACMRRITADATRAGAFGFSTSRTLSHKSLSGDPIPTLKANEEELTGIALGVREGGGGFFEVNSDWSDPDAATEFGMLRRVCERTGQAGVFSLNERYDRPQVWRELQALATEAHRDGVPLRPVVAPRPIAMLLGLTASQHPFSGTPSYKRIAALPLAERVRIMSDPEFRRQLLSEDPIVGSTFPLIRRLTYSHMFRFGNPPNYTPRREDAITEIAKRQGRKPAEVAYDIMIEDGGQNFIYFPVQGYARYDMSTPEELLADRNSIMGLGDGGAHVGFILDAGFQSWMLTYWARERRRFPIEEVVRRMTSDTADAAGLADRGRIAPGQKADLNVIDFDRVSFGRPYVAFDLPAGGRRLLQKAAGYEATIVSGAVTYHNGEPTGALPGRVVRGRQTLA